MQRFFFSVAEEFNSLLHIHIHKYTLSIIIQNVIICTNALHTWRSTTICVCSVGTIKHVIYACALLLLLRIMSSMCIIYQKCKHISSSTGSSSSSSGCISQSHCIAHKLPYLKLSLSILIIIINIIRHNY